MSKVLKNIEDEEAQEAHGVKASFIPESSKLKIHQSLKRHVRAEIKIEELLEDAIEASGSITERLQWN